MLEGKRHSYRRVASPGGGVDRQTDGWIDGGMNGGMDGQTRVKVLPFSIVRMLLVTINV